MRERPPEAVSRRRVDAGGGRRRRTADSARARGARPCRGWPSARPRAGARSTSPIPHSVGPARTMGESRRDRRSMSTKAPCIPCDDRRAGRDPRGAPPAPARARAPRGNSGSRECSAAPAEFRRGPGGSRPGHPTARRRTPPGAPERPRRNCCAYGSRGGNRARGDLGRRKSRASKTR